MRRESFEMGMDEIPGACAEVDVLDLDAARKKAARDTDLVERLRWA